MASLTALARPGISLGALPSSSHPSSSPAASSSSFLGHRLAFPHVRHIRPAAVHHGPVFASISGKYLQRTSEAASFSGRQDHAPVSLAAVPVETTRVEPRWQRLANSVLKGAAVGILALALAFGPVGGAEAARSGGRVGGSSFSSARSYSGGGSRSYGGGGGSLGSGSYGGGLSTAPRLGAGVGASSFFFPTYGYGYGYGGGYGVPVGGGGGGFVNILFWGFAAFVLLQVAQTVISNNQDGGTSLGGDRVAVAKLQVGLLGSARDLKRDLDKMAKRADTTSPEGLHYVLQETVLALARNPEYVVYGGASVRSARGLDDGEQTFNEVSMEERTKVEEETLVNVGGRTKNASYSRSAGDRSNELIVVTILVAAQAGLKLPKVSSREELSTALSRLGSLRSDQVLALEVLWTPQDERDSYTQDDLINDYPTLNTL